MRVDPFELSLAFLGGLLISVASSFNLLMKGRITGMSGLISGVIGNQGSQWKISLLSGIGITSCIFWLIFKFNPINDGKTYIFPPPQDLVSGLNIFGFGLAGLIVGVGTKLGNGCTSGHGVCGLPRLSLRSFVAVMVFMSLGVSTATLRFYHPFLQDVEGLNVIKKINYDLVVPIMLAIIWIFYIGYIINLHHKSQIVDNSDLIISFLTGVIFTCGLIVSGMIKREKVLGFLTLNENWDPSLALVMGGAALPNLFSFNYILKKQKPIYSQVFDLPANKKVDFQLIFGAALFGIGWGLCGICPGPAFVVIPIFTPHISIIFILALIMGYFLATKIQGQQLQQSDSKRK